MAEKRPATSVWMSAFGAKADLKWCWLKSPLLTHSGRQPRRRMLDYRRHCKLYRYPA
jgi:hypothetical protein